MADIKRKAARGIAVIAIALGAGQLAQSMTDRGAPQQPSQGERQQDRDDEADRQHRDVGQLRLLRDPPLAAGARGGDVREIALGPLAPEEAEALFLSGLPGPAAELGLGTVVAGAQLKVLASLPPELRTRASRLVERFHPLVLSSGFHETIEPVLARDGIDVERLAGHAFAERD